ncbi:hypothetical protein JOQ06_018136, partial [Pogonophryne albipinna]
SYLSSLHCRAVETSTRIDPTHYSMQHSTSYIPLQSTQTQMALENDVCQVMK